jgi:DsbC/DsbD-like thiol-disulfide interchange protein
MARRSPPCGGSSTTIGRRAFGALGATVVLVALPARSDAEAGPWSEQREARVRLVSRWAEAPTGGDPALGLEFALAPGWHVYWKNAGDAGYPPKRAPSSGTRRPTVSSCPGS